MAQSTVEYPKRDVADITEQAPIRVLHVDDEAGFLKAAKQILEMRGAFQVDAASSVQDAIEKMEKNTYDAIVCDYVMPGKDGLQFLKNLRDSGNNIPFIIFTGKGREEVAVRALNLGADRYFNKIGDPETVYGELAHGIRQAVKTQQAEEALKESEGKFRNLVELSPDTIAVHSEGKIVYINTAGAKLLHAANPEQLIGKPITDFLHRSYREIVNKRIRKIRKKGKGVPLIEEKFIRLDGTEVDVEVAAIPFTYQGKPATIAIARDITERKKAEQELKESVQCYRQLFEGISDAVIVYSSQGRFLDCNKATLERLGYTHEEFLHLKASDIVHPDFHHLMKENQKKILSGETTQVESVHRCKDGTLIPVDVVARRIEYNGEPAILALVRNITQRKMAEDRLLYQASLLQNVSDAIIATDLDFRIRSWNKAAEIIYGWKEDEVLGKTVGDVTKGEYLHDKHEEVLKRFWKDGYWKGEVVQRHKNGEALIIQASVSLIKDSTGNPIGAVAVNRDITEHKKTEEQRNKLLRTIETSREATCIVSPDGAITYTNHAMDELFGYERGELIGKRVSIVNVGSEPEAEAVMKKIMGTLEKGEDWEGEVRNKKKDGTEFLSYARISVLRDESGKPVNYISTQHDITGRKRAERALRESEQKYRRIVELAPDGILTIDLKGKVTSCNTAILKQSGYSKEEVLGKHFTKLPTTRARDIPKFLRLFRDIIRGVQPKPFEFKWVHKDGTTHFAEIHIGLLKERGKTTGFQAILRDISERKNAEKELIKMTEKMRTSNEKLSVVGKLTRHDARNKLSAVTMNAFLAKEKLAGNSEATEHLNQIESAVKDVERIFEFARIYEKMGSEQLAYMDLERIIADTVILFSDLSGVKMVNDCFGLTVLADSLLRQLFYNLIDNSLKHGEKVSQIRVHYEEAKKDKLKLVYEDDGVGIPKSEKEEIFMEGYGKGGGYGLYLIRKMCEVYGWTIRETGKQGKGAQFTITIPKLSANGKTNYQLSLSDHA